MLLQGYLAKLMGETSFFQNRACQQMLKCIDMTEAMDEKMEVCPLSDVVEKEPKVEDLADSPYNARKPRNEMSRDISMISQ